MLEAGTGNAHLIEMNPRATQVGHLTLGAGRDLPGALYAAVSGEPLRETPPVTDKDTIALFPKEWIRDSAKSLLALGLSRCTVGSTRVSSELHPVTGGSR